MSTNAAILQNPVLDTPGDAAVVFAPIDEHGTVGWLEILRTAYESLLSNRIRSFLTMLGVIIGVASVVALMSIGTGASSSITNRIESMGTNLLTISNAMPRMGAPGQGSSSQNLSVDDADAMGALNLPVNGIAPQLSSSGSLAAPAADTTATIVGTTAAYLNLNNLTLKSGTFFTDAQNKSRAAVIVLGSTLATDLFGTGDAVGQTVRFGGQQLKVIGVLASKGGSGFGSVDSQAFVPIKYAYLYFENARTPYGNHYRVSSITVSVTQASEIDAVQGRLEALLRVQHNLPSDGSKDDFNVRNQSSMLETMSSVINTLTMFLAAVGLISLMVGGIGIMNIMLVSVTERTKEIGLRKAIGARERDVLLQFLAEAVALSVTSGLIGIAIGAGVALGADALGLATTTVSMLSIVVALGFAVAVGVFFGLYPARRASRLNPIEALRYE